MKFNESQVKSIDSELLFWFKFPLNKKWYFEVPSFYQIHAI